MFGGPRCGNKRHAFYPFVRGETMNGLVNFVRQERARLGKAI